MREPPHVDLPARMRGVQIDAYGPSDVIVLREIDVPVPRPDEVLVALAYAGINFMDVYTRLGRYAGSTAKGHYQSALPITLGIEGSGRIVSVGRDVRDWRPGDRVAYALSRGSYATYAAVPQRLLARVPDAIDLKRAAAILFQGLTAHYLVEDIGRMGPGRTALVHSAAGGIGQLLVQLAKAAGARVVATASSDAKRAIATERGADIVSDYDAGRFVDACERLTDGAGVDVAFDSVGASVLDGNLRALRTKGLFVHYGANSGPIGPLDVMRLADSGSLFFTRPRLADYVDDAASVTRRADRIFSGLISGLLTVAVDDVIGFDGVATAHTALETRRAVGKTVLAIDPSLD